ncbi:MAG: S41 family peptidase [bacterium]|nr:S41 family peptidase [bacterium]
MRKYILLIILFSVTIASMSCFAQTTDNPVENFEAMWNLYDSNYALFGPKNIDWDMIYELYRPKVNAGTTNEELFLILSNMLEHLNDNHVNLRSTNPRKRFNAGILNRMRMDDFSLDLIKRSYLNNEYDQKLNNFTYGWLTDEIGYFHFRGFRNPEASGRAIDEIIEYFSDAKGMVIDVRNNRGGDDWAGKAIADRFADRQRLYMKTYERSGPEHDDFNPPKYFYVEPNGKKQFTKPVILLTHRFSISAAENFALAMRVLPHVTVVGDFTSGVFADVYGDRLPNGWSVSISYKKFVDCNDFCWEGIGVPMDLRIMNSKEDIDNGTDRILDFAVGLINSGGINHQNEDDSLKDIRESLAQTLDKNIRSVLLQANHLD